MYGKPSIRCFLLPVGLRGRVSESQVSRLQRIHDHVGAADLWQGVCAGDVSKSRNLELVLFSKSALFLGQASPQRFSYPCLPRPHSSRTISSFLQKQLRRSLEKRLNPREVVRTEPSLLHGIGSDRRFKISFRLESRRKVLCLSQAAQTAGAALGAITASATHGKLIDCSGVQALVQSKDLTSFPNSVGKSQLLLMVLFRSLC